ncbi:MULTISPECIES: lipopolysaccharide biosynthesis protein [unclassified Sphingomonas]|uniref:lipopolysaccharide biosynthesis protein n=1 Tax=unclassified Sphingomonas TaxID=196159 RepID=UPI0006F983F0|nr:MULTISPECIES: lipopolysaccharide biosynthesis protein [unclassified Sphingomonas]KQX26168.1 hypothetical protein ASD17_01530 [Sphingomonas sp. Root1294]KQY69236.1 hypothetical protein ASD39_02730 [Sphingomonas sp. Root50]KRB89490.1 hypothetical protein ASE22_17635 [Sphingomonas sp. Root720]
MNPFIILRRRRASVDPFVAADPAIDHSTRVAKGGAVVLAGYAFTMATQIGQIALLSRLLPPGDFGLIGLATAITAFVKLFSDTGVSSATVQHRRIDHLLVSTLYMIELLVGVGLMLICWAIAPAAAWFFHDGRLTIIIMALALQIPLAALKSQHRALIARRMDFSLIQLGLVLTALSGFVVSVLLAWLTAAGYWSIVAGSLVSAIVDLVFTSAFSGWRPGRVSHFRGAGASLRFGLNIMTANFMGWLWRQSDNLLVGYHWGTVSLGYYTRAYSLMLLPLQIIGGPLGSALIPIFSRLQDAPEEWNILYRRSVRALTATVALGALSLTIAAPIVIAVVMGPGWDESAKIFGILCIAILPGSAWELSRIAYISLGRSDMMVRFTLASGILHVLAFVVGVRFGPVGVAWGLAIASWIMAPPAFYLAARIASMSPVIFLRELSPVLLAWVVGTAGGAALAKLLPIEPEWFRILAATGCGILLFVLTLLAGTFHDPGWRSDARLVRQKMHAALAG